MKVKDRCAHPSLRHTGLALQKWVFIVLQTPMDWEKHQDSKTELLLWGVETPVTPAHPRLADPVAL